MRSRLPTGLGYLREARAGQHSHIEDLLDEVLESQKAADLPGAEIHHPHSALALLQAVRDRQIAEGG